MPPGAVSSSPKAGANFGSKPGSGDGSAAGASALLLEPGPLDPTPYSSGKPKLPASLMEATAALKVNEVYRQGFGSAFVDYILAVKQSEIDRFLQHVTDWEHKEYFEVF